MPRYGEEEEETQSEAECHPWKKHPCGTKLDSI